MSKKKTLGGEQLTDKRGHVKGLNTQENHKHIYILNSIYWFVWLVGCEATVIILLNYDFTFFLQAVLF